MLRRPFAPIHLLPSNDDACQPARGATPRLPDPADIILTLAEAAARLRICSKTLATFLKAHPAEPPLYARVERQYLISIRDVHRSLGPWLVA
jgi:hypothetical protein